jgi:hypothetical protein
MIDGLFGYFIQLTDTYASSMSLLTELLWNGIGYSPVLYNVTTLCIFITRVNEIRRIPIVCFKRQQPHPCGRL